MREQGLSLIRKKYRGLELDIQEQRGEEIPGFVAKQYDSETRVLGITGEDLLDEYLLRTARSRRFFRRYELLLQRLQLIGRGPYSNAIFGLPALCILGEGGISLERFIEAYPKAQYCKQPPRFEAKTVAIPRRYEQLIRSRISLEGATVMRLDGKVDVTAARGEADYAIDIVLTGRTCKEEGLGFFPPMLYTSDGVILGNKMMCRTDLEY